MKFMHRLRAFSCAEPFEPFRIAATNGSSWIIERRESLTIDSDESTIAVLARDGASWRDWHLRASQIVTIDRISGTSSSDLEGSR